MDRADAKSTRLSDATAKLSLDFPDKSLDYESFEFTDDIDCKLWLTEINLAQYTETFLVNLSADNKHIRRKRLSQLRQQDLSKMNITNFSHQKRLMEHVRLVLRYPFHSPHRKREIRDLHVEPVPIDFSDAKSEDSKEVKSSVPSAPVHPKALVPVVDKSIAEKEKKKQARRRRSFDADVWNSISNMRRKTATSNAIADQLRMGVLTSEEHKQKEQPLVPNTSTKETNRPPKDKTRRWSFHGHDADSHAAHIQAAVEKSRALMYGNMALEYDMMLTNLHTLQTEYLNKFKNTINCEVASLFFVNNKTQELLLFSDNSKWYRVPFGVGICGYCVDTGMGVNIPDAYSDYRFNRSIVHT